MPDQSDLLRYYGARAHEYEKVYDKPERQDDLRRLHEIVPAYLAGRRALDVACGTGYWTRRIAQRALAITGCDQSPEVLALARERQPTANHVQFVIGNAFSLSDLSGEFDAAFVGFWWSHVPREDLSRFVRGLHERLLPRSRVFIVDNRYVAGSNWPITRTDSSGNTYQHRVLDNGVGHEVLKNFPAASELQTALTGAGARDVDIQELPYYWYAAYELAP